METTKYIFNDIVIGEEGLLKGPFGSDLKKELYVPKGEDTYKVYLQENILKQNNIAGEHYISKDYYEKSMKRYAVKEGDFIVTCDGTLGEIFQLKNLTEPGIISSSLLRITLDKKKCDEKFFPYFFKAKMKMPLITQANNSVLKHLPGLTNIRNFSIDLPLLTTQKKIASVLSALDDKIALNKKMNQKLEAMAKRLYDYWFVQFDFPDKNGHPYKTTGGPMTYNQNLKREIPAGWEQSSILLKNIFNSDFTANGSFNDLAENVKYNEGSPYALLIRIIDFNDDFAKSEKFIWVNKHSYDYLKTSSLHGGEIIICNVGNAGAVYRCPFLNCPMTLGPNGVVVNDLFYNNYLYMYFKSELGQQQLRSISSGSIQLKFNKTSFRNIPLLFPDKKTLSLFNEKYNSIYAQINNLWTENRKLTALRDKLLPLLMNGQVVVG